MGYCGSTTLLRGFKVSVAVLDAFLAANGQDETYGTPPFSHHHPDQCPISRLLTAKITTFASGATTNVVVVDKTLFRVLIPSSEGHNPSRFAYVTYAWVSVYAQREIDLDLLLPREPASEKRPAGFDELREEILGFADKVDDTLRPGEEGEEGKFGVYMVYTNGIRGLYRPKEFEYRAVVSKFTDLNEIRLAPMFPLFPGHDKVRY